MYAFGGRIRTRTELRKPNSADTVGRRLLSSAMSRMRHRCLKRGKRPSESWARSMHVSPMQGSGGSRLPFYEQPTDAWRRVWGVNLDGAFYTLRAAAKHMVERGEGGRLVGTSSTSAIHGAPRGQAYAASKGALIAMMRGLAVELARYQITSNVVIPGWIETPMTAGNVGNERFETAVIRRVPFRRWGTGDDFGGIAVYLASDASRYHTGDSFVIDGGYTRF